MTRGTNKTFCCTNVLQTSDTNFTWFGGRRSGEGGACMWRLPSLWAASCSWWCTCWVSLCISPGVFAVHQSVSEGHSWPVTNEDERRVMKPTRSHVSDRSPDWTITDACCRWTFMIHQGRIILKITPIFMSMKKSDRQCESCLHCFSVRMCYDALITCFRHGRFQTKLALLLVKDNLRELL